MVTNAVIYFDANNYTQQIMESSGLSSTTQFSIQEAEAFFLILLVYCQGYDPEI